MAILMNWPEPLPQGLCEECGKPHGVETKRGRCAACDTFLLRAKNGTYEIDEDQVDYDDPEPDCPECNNPTDEPGQPCASCQLANDEGDRADAAYEDARLGQ